MDVRTRVAACRLLEKMQKNPPAAERLGLVDSSKNFTKTIMIEKTTATLNNLTKSYKEEK